MSASDTTIDAPSGYRQLLTQWPYAQAYFPQIQRSMYDEYASLFAPAFPTASASAIEQLNHVARLFASAIVAIDNLADQDKIEEPLENDSLPIRATIMFHEGYQAFARLFPWPATIWGELRSHLDGYLGQLQVERQYLRGDRAPADFTIRDALDHARGKSAVAELVPLGLGALTGESARAGLLAESIGHMNVSTNLLDDVMDWRSDLSAGRPNAVLSATLRDMGFTGGIAEVRLLLADQKGNLAWHLLFGNGIRQVVGAADRAHAAALAAVDTFPLPKWREVILENEPRLQNAKRRLTERIPPRPPQRVIISFPAFSNRDVTPLSDVNDCALEVAKISIRALIMEARGGFPNARHLMALPAWEGFSGITDVQVGDVFTRAVIANSLANANRLLSGQLDDILKLQASQLMSRSRATEVGIWSYFQDLPELAPDADDVAEILRFMVTADLDDELRQRFTDCLDLFASSDSSQSPGAFRTWLIPRDESPLARRQRYFAEHYWGTDPDIEVIGNMLHSMQLFDPLRYQKAIESGLQYLAARQDPSGDWKPTWYTSQAWAARVITRALKFNPKFDATRQITSRRIAETQNSDGGWGGSTSASSPLETALVLITATEGLDDHRPHADWLAAMSFLAGARDEDAWPAEPLIRMNLGRAKDLAGPELTFGTSTLTTALVAHAASSWATRRNCE